MLPSRSIGGLAIGSENRLTPASERLTMFGLKRPSLAALSQALRQARQNARLHPSANATRAVDVAGSAYDEARRAGLNQQSKAAQKSRRSK